MYTYWSAVERADCGRRDAATGLDLPVEEPCPCRLVVAQRLRPVRLHAVDDADDAAVLPLVRIGARAALLCELGIGRSRADRLAGKRAQVTEAAASLARDHEIEDEDDDADQATAASGPCRRRGHQARRPGRDSPRPGTDRAWRVYGTASSALPQLACAAENSSMRFAIVLRHVLDVRRDPPQVAGRVANACRAVTVELVSGSRTDVPPAARRARASRRSRRRRDGSSPAWPGCPRLLLRSSRPSRRS